MSNKDKDLTLLFPFRGLDVGSSLANVGVGPFGTSVCSNVFPYDINGRTTGSVRPGIRTFPFDGSTPKDFTMVRYMIQGVLAANSTRLDVLVVVDNAGEVWVQEGTRAFVAAGHGFAGVYTPMNAGFTPSGAFNATKCFFANGAGPIRVLTASAIAGPYPPGYTGPYYDYVIIDLIETAGSCPDNLSMLTFWRNRLVGAGDPLSPGTVYASKSGDPYNWDFAVDLESANPAEAWAVNAAQAGQSADDVVALAAASDDTMITWGSRSMYRFAGDPTAGGSVNLVSLDTGSFLRTAHCFDTTGGLYWAGPNGLFKVGVGELSGSRLGNMWESQFGSHVELRFDKHNNGIWIFNCGSTNHLFYSLEFDGFYPMVFQSFVGPQCTLWYEDLTSASLSAILLGGPTAHGIIRYLGRAGNASNDVDSAGTGTVAIVSDVLLGPVMPYGDMTRARVTTMQAVVGPQASQSVNLDYSLIGGADPLSVLALAGANQTQTGTFTTKGRQHPKNHRMSANAFGVRVQNSTVDKTWSIERVVLHVTPAGRNR